MLALRRPKQGFSIIKRAFGKLSEQELKKKRSALLNKLVTRHVPSEYKPKGYTKKEDCVQLLLKYTSITEEMVKEIDSGPTNKKGKTKKEGKALSSSSSSTNEEQQSSTLIEKDIAPDAEEVSKQAVQNNKSTQAIDLGKEKMGPVASHLDLITTNLDEGPPGVTMVRTEAKAKSVIRHLMELNRETVYHACDTEVSGFQSKRSPINNGKVICASIYCGPEHDFGDGPKIFIDNHGVGVEGTLQLFKDYFENPTIKKVWHNYSFDFHELGNHGIHCAGLGADTFHMAKLNDTALPSYSLDNLSERYLKTKKVNMKERFAKRKVLKNGQLSKLSTMPGVLDIQLNPDTRQEWIEYSTLDTLVTWDLHQFLSNRLKSTPWGDEEGTNMLQFYECNMVPFAQCLTNMEKRGFFVRAKDYLPQVEEAAKEDLEKATKTFLAWAQDVCPGAEYMNINSHVQRRQLFFAPCRGRIDAKTVGQLPREKAFQRENIEGYVEENREKPKKYCDFTLVGLGWEPLNLTADKIPQTSNAVCEALSKRLAKEGDAEAAEALKALADVGSITKMLTGFIKPLQEMVDPESRVHGSMNFSTETGRLACKNPNLQNQPALEKDIYKVRQAFSAPPGKTLIVADYGQLELRILAGMSNCKSMIDAFIEGGDFHSRTAMGMFPYIREALDQGKVILEWDYTKGQPTVPLLKDVYASERRKAKTLNFSIAYGKTAHGLAHDWGVTKAEAEATLAAWYADRPEVKQWQQDQLKVARKFCVSRTLIGRYRHVPDILSNSWKLKGASERQVINGPVQGSAADVVMLAMLKLERHERFRELGWQMILQVHDEIIAEGPKESVKEAQAIVIECMENPFESTGCFPVNFVVDSQHADTWYEAK